MEKLYENMFYFSRHNAETGNMFVFDERTFGTGWKDTRSGYCIFFNIFNMFLKKVSRLQLLCSLYRKIFKFSGIFLSADFVENN